MFFWSWKIPSHESYTNPDPGQARLRIRRKVVGIQMCKLCQQKWFSMYRSQKDMSFSQTSTGTLPDNNILGKGGLTPTNTHTRMLKNNDLASVASRARFLSSRRFISASSSRFMVSRSSGTLSSSSTSTAQFFLIDGVNSVGGQSFSLTLGTKWTNGIAVAHWFIPRTVSCRLFILAGATGARYVPVLFVSEV